MSNEPPEIPQQQQTYQQKPMGEDAGMRMVMPVGRSGWAIAAGYLGLFSLLLFPGPIALICGLLGIREIKKSQGTDKPKFGMGRAIFGVIAGILATAAIIFFVIVGLTS